MDEIRKAKQEARQQAKKVRDRQTNRGKFSKQITDALLCTPVIQQADCVCCYVSFRSEVETHSLIERLIKAGKTICVPWCDGDELQLCEIHALSELETGTFGILEPPERLCVSADRQRNLGDCQVAIVPGLAFTWAGSRLGYGRGYYDRLLATSPKTSRVALAFDCQITETIPVTEFDETMNAVVTESGIRQTMPTEE